MENSKFQEETLVEQDEVKAWVEEILGPMKRDWLGGIPAKYSSLSLYKSIAYLDGNRIKIGEFYHALKDKVWGIQLPNGVVVSLKFYNGISWDEAKNLASTFQHGDKFGRLPCMDDFSPYDIRNAERFKKVQDWLDILNVPLQKGYGNFWLGDEPNKYGEVYGLNLERLYTFRREKDRERIALRFMPKEDRLALIF